MHYGMWAEAGAHTGFVQLGLHRWEHSELKSYSMLDVSDPCKPLNIKVSSFISPSEHLQNLLYDRLTCVLNMKLCEPGNPYVFLKCATFHQIVAVCIGLDPFARNVVWHVVSLETLASPQQFKIKQCSVWTAFGSISMSLWPNNQPTSRLLFVTGSSHPKQMLVKLHFLNYRIKNMSINSCCGYFQEW